MPGTAARAGDPTYLLSLKDIPVGENEFLDQFTVTTWAVDFIAVCRIAPGWFITAGRGGDPEGRIAGFSDIGVANLDPKRLFELTDLALVRVGQIDRRPQRIDGGVRPATFSGRAEIGLYGLSEHRRRVRLTIANVGLKPASRCPSPSQPQTAN